MNATARRPNPRLGNYEPLLELASGGMATVYVARQVGAAGFERLVVVKRVHRHHLGNREFYRMFLDEARVASLVRHPNVVSVIDTVEEGGELFLVMEYVESSALSSLLKTVAHQHDRLPPAVAARILADTLAGLHAAHEAVDMRGERLELVHRDVSPQNVIIGVDGGSRLIDFGVAKAAHRLTETRSGSLKGKLAYMSPEQAMGKEVDRRVDLFAAGVALHEALTGRRLFQGENDLDTMRRITEMPVRDPSSIAPGVPRSLDAVVQRALVRDPNGRFQTAAEFLEALEGAIPLAPLREVAAYMISKCGDRLDERRIRLKEIVEGRVPPLSLSVMPAAAADPSTDRTVVPGRLSDAPSQPSQPQPLQQQQQQQPQELPRNESSYSQISHIAASTTSLVPGGHRTPPAVVYALIGVALALGLVIAFGQYFFLRSRTRTAATATATSSASALPAGAATATGDEVTLVVHADAPISNLEVLGGKNPHVQLENDHATRDKATVRVARFTGTLTLKVTFDGGGVALVIAGESGPRELTVAAAAASGGGGPGTGTGVGPGADKPGKPAGGRRPPQDPSGVKRPELQDNPY